MNLSRKGWERFFGTEREKRKMLNVREMDVLGILSKSEEPMMATDKRESCTGATERTHYV